MRTAQGASCTTPICDAAAASRDAHLRTSRVAKKLSSGQPGTKRLQQLHGCALVCVRHRHDALKLYRFTTVELVVDAAPIHPRQFDAASFGIRLYRQERELRRQLIVVGARWDPRDQLWWVRGAVIRTLGLVDRICKL